MFQLRVLVVMKDTLMANALVGYLGSQPEVLVQVASPRHWDKQIESFAPQVVLVDRDPPPALLGLLAKQPRCRLAVLRSQDAKITMYEVSQRLVEEMRDLVPALSPFGEQPQPAEGLPKEASAMHYARITRLQPIPERQNEAQELLDSYLGWLQLRPGFVLGLSLTPTDHGHPLARVAVWEGRGWADATALSEHALAIRLRLIALSLDQTIHEEEFMVHLTETAKPLIASVQ
jgi:hypothetical protein